MKTSMQDIVNPILAGTLDMIKKAINPPANVTVQCPHCGSTAVFANEGGQVSGFCPKCGDIIEMEMPLPSQP